MEDTVSVVCSLLGLGGVFTLFIMMIIGLKRHVQVEGSMQRGVPIWKDQAPPEQVETLRALGDGQHIEEWGWVRVFMGTALLYADLNSSLLRPNGLRRKTAWPYVLQVDLQTGRRSWRIPLAMALFVVPHTCAFPPFVALMFYFNHRFQVPLYTRALELLAEAQAARS